MKRMLSIFWFLCCLSASAQTTYYIDWTNGLDSNTGLDTAHPFKNHPYFTGFSGTYTWAAGDDYIFKGNTTWPSNCFLYTGLGITHGGTAGNHSYWGTNGSWYAGTPGYFKFDGGYSVPTFLYFSSDGVYVDICGLEAFHIQFQTPTGGDTFIGGSDFHDVTLTNCYLHGWRLTNSITVDQINAPLLGHFDGFYGITNLIADTIEIENSENGAAGLWNGECVSSWGVIKHYKIHDNSSGIVYAQDVNFGEFYNIQTPYTGFYVGGSFHQNGFYMDNPNGAATPNQPMYFRNSYIHDCSQGANMAYPNIDKADCYIYNNVFYGIQSSQLPINIDPLNFNPNLIPLGSMYSGGNFTVTGLVSGNQYYWTKGANDAGCAGLTSSGAFTASGTTQLITGTGSSSVTASIVQYVGYSCYVFNNTFTNYANSSVAIHYSVRTGTIASNLYFQNNVIMGVSASLTDANSGNCVNFITSSNLVLSPSSSSPYYSSNTLYAPQSAAAPSVGIGANLSAIFTTDINGVSRGPIWDCGAYQFPAGLYGFSILTAPVSARSKTGNPVTANSQ